MANCFYVIAKMRHLYKFIISAGEHRKRHNLRVYKQDAVADRLNSLSLGTTSASAYIENLAKNSTCLINY